MSRPPQPPRRQAVRTGLSALVLACAWVCAAAQPSLPPIFDAAVPDLRPAKTLASVAAPAFLENLVVDAAGTLYVTSHLDGVVYRMRPGATLERFAQVQGKLAGIALLPAGGLVLTGSDNDGKATMFRVGPDGSVRIAMQLPQAQFLNGMTLLSGDDVLVADSYKGAIWRVNLRSGRSDVWLQHEGLARTDASNPTPGVNGIRRDGQRLLVSNTAQQILLSVAILPGGKAGEVKVLHRQVNVDDFALDRDGSIIAATHVYNSVVRIARDGRISVLAGAEQGVVGSTAVAFGRAPGDGRSLYVTTNGGLFLPPANGVESGKLVRLQFSQ